MLKYGEGGQWHYEMMGECYVYGMMDGEAMAYQNNEGKPTTVFEIRWAAEGNFGGIVEIAVLWMVDRRGCYKIRSSDLLLEWMKSSTIDGLSLDIPEDN